MPGALPEEVRILTRSLRRQHSGEIKTRAALEALEGGVLLDLWVARLIHSSWKEVMIAMAKALARAVDRPHISSTLHRHLKKARRSDATLKDIQRSLSGIGVSLSKRVIEERDKR